MLGSVRCKRSRWLGLSLGLGIDRIWFRAGEGLYTPRKVQICIITHNCIIAKNIFETSILASRYVSNMFC